jgi:hypothetical protein
MRPLVLSETARHLILVISRTQELYYFNNSNLGVQVQHGTVETLRFRVPDTKNKEKSTKPFGCCFNRWLVLGRRDQVGRLRQKPDYGT